MPTRLCECGVEIDASHRSCPSCDQRRTLLVRHGNDPRQCQWKNASGYTCGAVVKQGVYCRHHEPKPATPQISAPAIEYAATLKRDVIKIDSLEDLKGFLVKVITEVRKGDIGFKEAAVIKGLLELLKDVLKDIKPPEDPDKYKARVMVMMAEGMTVDQAWAILQDPSRQIQALADKAMDSYRTEGAIDVSALETAKADVMNALDAITGEGDDQ